LHHADHLASRIEHDNKTKESSNHPTTLVKSSKPTVTTVLEAGNTSVDDLFKDFFKK
jgi:hypothetical protein